MGAGYQSIIIASSSERSLMTFSISTHTRNYFTLQQRKEFWSGALLSALLSLSRQLYRLQLTILYQNINQRRTAWSLVLELTPNMPPIFSAFFHGKPRPGVPYTEQAILRKDETLRVKTPSYDPERGGDIPTTKLTSLQSGIKASDVPQWLWTRDECRAWMYAVLVHYLNVSKLVTLNFPPYRALYIESVLWYPSQ